ATVADDPGVDALTVMGLLEPDAFDLPGAVRSVAAPGTTSSDIPILAVVGGPAEAVAATRAGLAAGGVPSFDGVAGAVAGLRALVDDARARAGRAERGEPVRLIVPQSFRVPSGEDEGKGLLDWLGLATPARLACDDRHQARQARRLLRPPLAVKMLEPVVAHKARAGGVRLGVGSEADMEDALDALDGAGARRYLVEEMIAPGVDLIVGARRDPVFGPVVVLGLGGDEAEALDAVAVRLAPLGEREAAAMLDELPGAGRAGGWASRVEPEAVAGVVATLGALLVAVPELDEIEINPLRVTADGRLVALDVVVAGGPEAATDPSAERMPALRQATGGN
ncbi:MAG TPA: acetate--CoA ligase family protein, partial [Acidimicrobiia bacterium]